MVSTTVHFFRIQLKHDDILKDAIYSRSDIPSVMLEIPSKTTNIDAFSIGNLEEQVFQGGVTIGIILSLAFLIRALAALVKASQS